MTLIEAESFRNSVNQAAGHDHNIWLGTSIDDLAKDEIRVAVVATFVKIRKYLAPQPRQKASFREPKLDTPTRPTIRFG